MKDAFKTWGIFFILLFAVIGLAGVRVHPEQFKMPLGSHNYFKRLVTYEAKKNFFLKFSMNKKSESGTDKSPFERAMFSDFFYPQKKATPPPPQKPVSPDAMKDAQELAGERKSS